MKTVTYITCVAFLLTLCGMSYGAQTYVDARGGASGNTVNASTGSATDWWVSVAAQDNLWGRRTGFANNQSFTLGGDSDILESSGTGSGRENSPMIKTTISGLNAGLYYNVWVVYWSADGQDWMVRAGLNTTTMPLYDAMGTSPAVAGTATGKIEGNRREYTRLVGYPAADGSGTVSIYIDDRPSSASQGGYYDRSWYDGLLYEVYNVANNPSPADGAVNVPQTTTVLSFGSMRDPNNLALENPNIVRHNVYFDDDPNLADTGDLIGTPLRGTNQVTIPGGVSYDKKYYWRVDEVLTGGTVVTGVVWTFETAKTTPSFVPPIGSQPQNTSGFEGDTVLLTASAGIGSYTYRWYKGVSGDTSTQVSDQPGHISGVTTNTLTIKLELADEGLYWCFAQNGAGSANSNAAMVTVKRLVAHWKLDGDPNDSANGYNATLAGAPVFETSGIDGQAMIFDGTDDVIELPDAFDNFAVGLTFYVWAKPSAASNWARFIDMAENYNGTSTTGDDNILLARNSTSTSLTFEVWNNTATAGTITAANAITLDEWQMFAATLDEAGNVVLYKNGLQIQTGSSGLPNNVMRSSGFIGKSNWSADALYAGQMDDVRIYNYARSGYDVAGDYIAFVPGTSICVEYPEFDIAGPAGAGAANRDCKVTLYDFAEMARHWLECNNVPVSNCP